MHPQIRSHYFCNESIEREHVQCENDEIYCEVRILECAHDVLVSARGNCVECVNVVEKAAHGVL